MNNPDKLAMRTPSLADANFAALAALFPNAVTETVDENGEVVRAIDKDVLTQEINARVVEGREERYQFTWPDKRKSILLANALTDNSELRTPNSALGVGFRVLKLDSTNMKDVYYTPDEYAQMNFSFDGLANNIKEERTDEDLLFQVLLDLGIPLSAKITRDGDVYYVNDNYLIACFKRVDTALVTEIAKQKPYYAVFRDSSFASDSAMVNFEQVFNTYSSSTIRRVL
jgi:hypothetical protein